MWLVIQRPVFSSTMGEVQNRDAVLHERLAIRRHARVEPADARSLRAGVVDRHTPFEVVAGEQRVRPEADTADSP